jgi:chaperonin GroES
VPQQPPSAPDLTPGADGSVPIKLLHDRVLVHIDTPDGERRSGGGILIPATAAVGKRLTWATAVAIGPLVRAVEVGDQVLFEPEERAEVELRGEAYVLLRERDIHAVAATRVGEGETGLYL